MAINLLDSHETTLAKEILGANPHLPQNLTENSFSFRNMTPTVNYGVTIDVDLLVAPSEVYADYVEFAYDRIPLHNVFKLLDHDKGTSEIEVQYSPEDDVIIASGIENFRDIFDSWYRYSHHPNLSQYPGLPDEVNNWIYIEDIDTIECTANTSSSIGFMSTNKTRDFDFNTVITSNNSDDDFIGIVLCALQHDVDTVRDETLSVICNSGGNSGGRITLFRNFYDNVGYEIIKPIDAYQPPPNPNNQWSRYPWSKQYAHVVAQRRGNLIKVWALQEDFAGYSGDGRDANIKAIVRRVRDYTELDFELLNYHYVEYDLTGTPFADRECRFGYSSASQPGSRFWNIIRPGEDPNISEEFRNYFKNKFGFNIGNYGIKVSDYGQNRYRITVDNLLYKGDIIMVP